MLGALLWSGAASCLHPCLHCQPASPAAALFPHPPPAPASLLPPPAAPAADNVIRAGLTPKLRDTQVLCESLTYGQGAPEVLTGAKAAASHHLACYRPPFRCVVLAAADVWVPPGACARWQLDRVCCEAPSTPVHPPGAMHCAALCTHQKLLTLPLLIVHAAGSLKSGATRRPRARQRRCRPPAAR